jgi:hypothetical protein
VGGLFHLEEDGLFSLRLLFLFLFVKNNFLFKKEAQASAQSRSDHARTKKSATGGDEVTCHT